LLLTIEQTSRQTDRLDHAIVQAAVHGWMDGHLAADGHQLLDLPTDDPMPSPPFPDRDDARLAELIRDLAERLTRASSDG
jgi:hypothetical protein